MQIIFPDGFLGWPSKPLDARFRGDDEKGATPLGYAPLFAEVMNSVFQTAANVRKYWTPRLRVISINRRLDG